MSEQADQDLSPGGPLARVAYSRLHRAIRSIEKLGLLPSQPADIRYGQELTSELYGALCKVLIDKGVITQHELNVATLDGLQERAASFERRVHAFLDGQKDMPQ